MITPKNKTESGLLWLASFVGALLLAFLTSLSTQLGGTEPINWREITLDVIQTILSLAPVFAAGLGLPRMGKEPIANLVNEVGTERAKIALENEASTQGSSRPDVDMDQLADIIMRKNDERTAQRIASYKL